MNWHCETPSAGTKRRFNFLQFISSFREQRWCCWLDRRWITHATLRDDQVNPNGQQMASLRSMEMIQVPCKCHHYAIVDVEEGKENILTVSYIACFQPVLPNFHLPLIYCAPSPKFSAVDNEIWQKPNSRPFKKTRHVSQLLESISQWFELMEIKRSVWKISNGIISNELVIVAM